MKLPFTQEQFFAVFAAYNAAIWPFLILAYAAGVAAVVLLAARIRWAGRLTPVLLAVYWAWMGVAYHIVFFRPINPVAAVFGALFVVQAALFAMAAATGRVELAAPRGRRAVIGAVLLLASPRTAARNTA